MRSRPPSFGDAAIEPHGRQQVFEGVPPLAVRRQQAAEPVVRLGVVRVRLQPRLQRLARLVPCFIREGELREQARGDGIAREACRQLAGAVGLALVEQDRGERHRGAPVVGIPLQRLLQVEPGGAGLAHLHRLRGSGNRAVGGARHERVEEAADLRLRQRADELAHHLAVAEGLHRGDALHLVAAGDAGVLVHVDLDELHLAGALCRDRLEGWTQHAAGAAPGRPEIDHHGQFS